jgi:hypothetical protein
MKNFVSVLLFSILMIASIPKSDAQTRTSTLFTISQGQFTDFGGSFYPLVASDSLQVTDSLGYIIPITHTNEVAGIYHNWFWKNYGSGTATVTVNYFQSNDGVNFFPVKAGVAQANYSKTFTLSANTYNETSFARDTARFDGLYLKVQMFTSATANVGGKVVHRLKTYYR